YRGGRTLSHRHYIARAWPHLSGADCWAGLYPAAYLYTPANGYVHPAPNGRRAGGNPDAHANTRPITDPAAWAGPGEYGRPVAFAARSSRMERGAASDPAARTGLGKSADR